MDGNIWGVGRNEDGDDSGWGSRIFSAPAEDLSDWTWTEGLGIDRLCPVITGTFTNTAPVSDTEIDPNVRKNLIQRYMKVPECSDMEKIYILLERLILDYRTIGKSISGNSDW